MAIDDLKLQKEEMLKRLRVDIDLARERFAFSEQELAQAERAGLDVLKTKTELLEAQRALDQLDRTYFPKK